jgi:hypothetical protein
MKDLNNMVELKYKTTVVETLPERKVRKYKKTSQYDAPIDDFIKANTKYMEITVEGKEASYLQTQFNKRIDKRELEGIESITINGICYLTKVEPKEEEEESSPE